MIEEQYVSIETAKLAKEKGFIGVWCRKSYYNNSLSPYPSENATVTLALAAPTQSLLAKWLRENNRISVEYYFEKTSMDWFIAIVMMDEVCHTIYLSGFNTCEEAIEAGLKEALKII